jgi:ankyrin repeat protein
MVACANGQVNVAKLLLEKGARIDATDFFQCTALHFASFPGLLGLTWKGMNQTYETGYESRGLRCNTQTMYSEWSTCCQNTVVRNLIEEGADINAVDALQKTALHYACMNNPNQLHKLDDQLLFHQSVDYLKRREWVHNEMPEDESKCGPYMKKYLDDAIGVVTTLLNKGADPEARDGDGFTSLHYACESGFTRVTEMLLQRTPSLMNSTTNSGSTPIHVACKNRWYKVIIVLIQHGATLSVVDNEGKTPLVVTCKEKDAVSVRILVQRVKWLLQQLSLNDARRFGCSEALHLACSLGTDLEIVRKLLEVTDIDSPDDQGLTPLHQACKHDFPQIDLVEILLNVNGDVNAVSIDGFTPLHFAAASGHLEILRLLLNTNEVQVNAETKERKTPLGLACLVGHTDAVDLLVRHGAEINKPNEEGNTYLHNACL